MKKGDQKNILINDQNEDGKKVHRGRENGAKSWNSSQTDFFLDFLFEKVDDLNLRRNVLVGDSKINSELVAVKSILQYRMHGVMYIQKYLNTDPSEQ